MENTTIKPDAPTGKKFGTKQDVAAMFGVCLRTVDNLLAKGMPHLKLGSRRCRFDLADVEQWANRSFRVERYGRAGK